MTDEELREIAKIFINGQVPHVLLVRTDKGITLSSIASAEEMYEYLQVLIDCNPLMLDIMKDVVDSRDEQPTPQDDSVYLN